MRYQRDGRPDLSIETSSTLLLVEPRQADGSRVLATDNAHRS